MKNKQEIDKKNHQFRSYINSILCFSNDCEEEKISSEIIKHKLFMEDRLGRNLGIEVALLDYIKNINKDIHVPAIFKSLDIFKIHHSLSNHNENIKYYDRSVLSQDIKIEIERAHRYGSHFSILMFDLTNQDNSDPSSISSQILQSLNKCIRLTDTIYSYEINRYVLLLPETGPDEAVNAAEKLQEKFKNSELDEDSQFPSINIGVAIFGLYKI
ncbi:MAG: hypothetical protein JEY91_17515, partial [Spirochaetaceae bacterium]|nr:hypothetical protein [Spirochaetaceae bacterium]